MIDLSFIVVGVYYFLRLLTWLIVARIIFSWVAPGSHHPVARFLFQTTEPILGPIRERLPRGEGMMAMMDWSPLIALLLIDILRYTLISWFA